MWYKRVSTLIFFLLLLPGCFGKKALKIKRRYVLQPEQPLKPIHLAPNKNISADPITIWIHGTRMLPKGMFESFFYSRPGLHHFLTYDEKYKIRRVAQAIASSDPELFSPYSFYVFGWSGELSFQERRYAARDLYIDLRKLRAEYKKQHNQEPTIRIITHSHGGNVALNVAAVVDPDDTDFYIEELYLLACPVQIKTADLCKDEIFKKIYSLYSTLDMIQVIDPQGLYTRYRPQQSPIFSRRMFDHDEKISQIQVKIDRHACLHVDFIRQDILSNFGPIVREIKAWHEQVHATSGNWHDTTKLLCLYSPWLAPRILRNKKVCDQ